MTSTEAAFVVWTGHPEGNYSNSYQTTNLYAFDIATTEMETLWVHSDVNMGQSPIVTSSPFPPTLLPFVALAASSFLTSWIKGDGTVVVHGSSTNETGVLGLDAITGRELWFTQTYANSSAHSSVQMALGYNGFLYVTYEDGGNNTLSALSANGEFQYRCSNAGMTPVIRSDGNVVVTGGDDRFLVIDGASCDVLWTFSAPGEKFDNWPALGSDDQVFIATHGHLYAVDSNGQELWNVVLPPDSTCSPLPVVDANDIIYFLNGCDGDAGDLVALDGQTGLILWTVDSGASRLSVIEMHPVITSDGDLVCAVGRYAVAAAEVSPVAPPANSPGSSDGYATTNDGDDGYSPASATTNDGDDGYSPAAESSPGPDNFEIALLVIECVILVGVVIIIGGFAAFVYQSKKSNGYDQI